MAMDFQFLFDSERKLFAIGFQQSSHSLDGSYYDLLGLRGAAGELPRRGQERRAGRALVPSRGAD
jgi:hypothetical protein